MSRFFPTRDASGDAWFRLGRLDVTSTLLAVLLGAVGILASVVVPGLPGALAYVPSRLLGGEFWRVFTWPLAEGISLWSVLNLVLLWYFGRDLESMIGRRPMAGLLLGIWGSLTLATTLVSFLAPGVGLGGMGQVEFAVLLLWIAEYPTRRFLFNIPAWVFGALLVALQVLTMIAVRAWGELLSLLLALFLIAVSARSVGLLSAYGWLPGGRRPAPTPRAPKPGRQTTRAARRSSSDEERMDALLAKISAEGLHALSKGERAELEKLRQRRRR